MDTPMTREDVKAMEQLILGTRLPKFVVLPDSRMTVSLDSAIAHLIDHDAALREELAQRDHDIVRLADQVDAAERRANISAAKTERLRKELTQVKQELQVMTESKVRCWNEWTFAEQQVKDLGEKLEQERDEVKQSRHDIIQDFIRGKDKLCLVCGAKEPCKLKDDPLSPCTFDPTPMELLAAYRRQVKQINELEKRAQIADWYESLVTRACIGTSKTPSLKAYIEQLEARVKERRS